ncbi:unnamed protein product [Diamesa serratosioi]
MKSLIVCCFVGVLIGLAESKYPKNLPKCGSGDTVCLPGVITQIVKQAATGVPGINLIPVEPLIVPGIDIIQGSNSPIAITLNFRNVSIYGITALTVTKVVGFEKDPRKSKFEVYARVPLIQLISRYRINGKVLILPIQGNGNSNITLSNLDINIKFKPKMIQKNGKEYLQADNFKLSFETTRLYLKLENLFNGDKALGDNMNLFLNDNWEDILKELKPAVSDALSQIFAAIINAVFGKVPYNEIFTDSD